MNRPHLALSQRPEPEALARRWFTYFICTIAAAILGIWTLLLTVPERPGTNPRVGDARERAAEGTRAPPPIQKMSNPHAPTGPNPAERRPMR
jgi:hypothetical protein